MFATDFVYDNHWLSDFGCTICTFGDSNGITTVSAGSQITFNTISRNKGKQRSLIGSQYDFCIQTTFDICKKTYDYNAYNIDRYFSMHEVRELILWLNREEFHKFRPMGLDEVIYYNASFNVERIEIDNKVVGLRLTMLTDSPYAYGNDITTKFEVTRTQLTKEHNTYCSTDYYGDIIPNVKITCAASGDISIANQTNGITMTIMGCTKGEIITINGDRMTLTSSTGRNLYNSFNYEFLKITNTPDVRINKLTISLPSTVEITYTPIVKYGA